MVCAAKLLAMLLAAAIDILTAWPGAWSCTSTASNFIAPVHLSMQGATYGKWVQFNGNEPAHDGNPARAFVMLVTYNRHERKWFIDSYSESGGMILSTSSAAPDATRQTWTNIYPVNPNQSLGTIVATANTWDTYDSWRDKGKRLSSHVSCKKT